MNVLNIIKKTDGNKEFLSNLYFELFMQLPADYIIQFKDLYDLFVNTKPSKNFAHSIYAAIAHSQQMGKTIGIDGEKKELFLTLSNIKTLHKHNFIRGTIEYDGNIVDRNKTNISLEDIEFWTISGASFETGIKAGIFEKQSGSEYLINLQDSKNSRSKTTNKLDAIVKMIELIVNVYPEEYREEIIYKLLQKKTAIKSPSSS